MLDYGEYWVLWWILYMYYITFLESENSEFQSPKGFR